MKKILSVAAISAIAAISTGCMTDANVASRNLALAAEMFEIQRRVVFYNGITGEYILTIEGKCSIDGGGKQLAATCKVGDGQYKKHHLGLSDNVTYFSEQLDAVSASSYHTRIIFKPQSILPSIDARVSGGELLDAAPSVTVE